MLRLLVILCFLFSIACSKQMYDRDSDGVADATDNCVAVPNSNQADRDGDGLGDVCDTLPETPQYTVSSQAVEPSVQASNGSHRMETGGQTAATVSTDGRFTIEARVTQ